MTKRYLSLLTALLVSAVAAWAQYGAITPNPIGEAPVIIPLPESVAGVKTPVVNVSDGWYSKQNPEDNFYLGAEDTQGFVPAQTAGGGLPRRAMSTSVGLKKKIHIPEAFAGQRTIIRFTNTSHQASLWVNGLHVRDYWGAFSAWNADITDFVKPGEDAVVSLLLTRTDGVGKHIRFTGGSSNDVKLFAVPQTYVQRMRLDTEFDSQYRDATLKLRLKVSEAGAGSVRIAVTDAQGKRLSVSPATVKLPQGMDEFEYGFAVKRPLKWDAEHPRLYTVKLSLLDSKGRVTETLEQKYGFRQVELRENQLYVNGEEVKCRGLWGSDEPLVLRDLNINHTRQKWATEEFLNQCDSLGVYVLDENAIDFAKFGAELDTTFMWQWVDLMAEKIEFDYNHPSVIMWGLGNESFTGPNVLASYKYVKEEDPARPTIFSWGYRVKEDEEIPFDIFSCHYAPVADPTVSFADYMVAICNAPNAMYDRKEPVKKMPVLIDESNHVTIPMAELTRDPNVRNFWGEGLGHTWERIWNTPGSLGLDQFGLYRYMTPGQPEMPEIWAFRKAFSPFVIHSQVFDNPGEGKPLQIEVENRFSHTNLSEIDVLWKVGDASGKVKGPNVASRGTGMLTIPYTHFKDGDILELYPTRSDGYQIDEYRLEISPEPVVIPEPAAVAPVLEDTYQYITITGKDFVLTFDKFSGQIKSVVYKGETVISGGPHLNVMRSGLAVVEYWPINIASRMEGREAVIDIETCYAPIFVDMQIRVDGDGVITTGYKIKHIPNKPPQPFTLPWNEADLGGYSEVGIQYILPAEMDRIEWDRRSTWSVYPENHVGRPRGTAYKEVMENPVEWKDLNYDLYWLSGYDDRRETTNNDFRATKEYIKKVDVLLKGKEIGIEAFSQETDAVRMEVVQRTGVVNIYIDNLWNYPQLAVGNYIKPAIMIGDGYSNVVRMRLVDLSGSR